MQKKRILYLILIFFMLGLSMSIVSVKANPPSSINLAYNTEAEQLDVSITHINAGSSTHIIDQVVIKVNGITIKTQSYTSQPGNSFTYSYNNITATIGDSIQAVVRCTISGNFSKSIVVGSAPAIPGYSLFLVCTAIVLLPLILIYYKRMGKVKN